MTVVDVKIADAGQKLANHENSYWAEYDVTTNDPDQGSRSVISQAQLFSPIAVPFYFATFSLFGDTDVNAFCQSIDAKRKSKKARSHWTIKVDWAPISGDAGNDLTTDDDPLTKPLEIWGGWETIQVPVEKGWNKQALTGLSRAADTEGPIQDAAGQEPSSPIMKPKKIPVLFFSLNYASLSDLMDLATEFADGLNDDDFYGWPEGTALYRGCEMSQPKYAGGMPYYTGVHAVAFQSGGWDYAMVNRGWKYLGDDPSNPGNTVLLECVCRDKDGQLVPVASPMNLELDGTLTPDGQMGTIIDYRTSPKLDFADLGVGGV